MGDQIQCKTTKGSIDITIVKEWSPLGAERFLQLVDQGYFQNIPLFRCVEHFLCQFGYKPHHKNDLHWSSIQDDVPNEKTPLNFKRGYLSFAGGGTNTRDSHLFITLGRNVQSLGKEVWETPIGFVSSTSMETVVSKWTTKYGDMPPWGKGPDPHLITQDVNGTYLKKTFPELDYILHCQVVKEQKKENQKTITIGFDLSPNLGKVVLELNPIWAPLGSQRLIDMITAHFLDQARFFRVLPGFVVQFGMPGDPSRAKEFPSFRDEPVKMSNVKGTISFATSGPNTRSFQLFINLGNNQRLDDMGFTPIGQVISGMDLVEKIYSGYRELPDQGQISKYGNEYLNKEFPLLSYIQQAYLMNPKEDLQHQEEITMGGGGGSLVSSAPPPLTLRTTFSFEFYFSVSMVLLFFLSFVLIIRCLFPSLQQDRKSKH